MKLNDLPVTFTVAACITAAALSAMHADARERSFPIDLEELKTQADAAFAAADTDGDGIVSSAEFEAADVRPERPGARDRRKPRPFLGRGDDGDRRTEVFAEADANDDGQLSEAEFEALPEAMRALGKRRLFARLDDNEDSSLSTDEFPSAYNRMAPLDANSDGQITRDELPRRPRRGRR